MLGRALWTVGASAVLLLIAGCSAATLPHMTSSPSPVPTSSDGRLGAGFWDPDHPPAPEGTFTPQPGSWDEVHTPAGYTVVLVTWGSDAQTRTLVTAVTSWAAEEHVTITTLVASSHDTLIATLYDAIAAKPDLIISAGDAMVDPLAAVSPSHLAQQFLVVGAEIAEPTSNVTAADWAGASFRGEGLGTPSAYDPATFTDERAGRAVRAGVAAVLNDARGFVVWVD